MCERQTSKKYVNRPSPPYPAAACAHEEREGNDGRHWYSAPVGNGYRWKLADQSEDCVIMGHRVGSNKKLYGFTCKSLKYGVNFTLKSGIPEAVVHSYKNTHPVGTVVTYAYYGLTDNKHASKGPKGLPASPKYLKRRSS